MNLGSKKRPRAEGFEDDALREVLAIERQAQGIINDAENEAQRIISAAQERATEIKKQAEQEAQEQAAASRGASKAKIEEEGRAIEQQAENDAQQWAEKAALHADTAVNYVLAIVALTGTNYGNGH